MDGGWADVGVATPRTESQAAPRPAADREEPSPGFRKKTTERDLARFAALALGAAGRADDLQ
jgi:hypothetical protein